MKLFKHLLIIILICNCASFANAQKCKFDKDETDPFTKERVRISKYVEIGDRKLRWWLQMEQNGNKYYLTYTIFELKEIHDELPKGTKILTKLENGKILEMVIDKDIAPTHNVEQMSVIVTQWKARIEVTADQMKLLSSSPTEAVRTSIGGVDVNSPDISGKEGEKIMNTATCMLSSD